MEFMRIIDKPRLSRLGMTKILIIGNANDEKMSQWAGLIEASEVIIACDGAIKKCLEQGISVDYLIGDMDSITQEMLAYSKNSDIKVIETHAQDNNDLTKAILFAQGLKANEIDIIGVDGGLSDHQFCNFLSLIECQSSARIHLDDCIVSAITKNNVALDSIETGTTFSLFSIGTSSGVNLTGAKWELKNSKLTPSSTGLHNIATGERLVITCESGNLLLFVHR